MKRLFALLLLLSLGLSAKAQTPWFVGSFPAAAFPTNYLTATNFVIGSTNWIQILNGRNVLLAVGSAGLTNSPVVGVAIARSLDGITSETIPPLWFVFQSGLSNCVAITNIDLGAAPYFSLFSFTNSATVTNASVRYSVKPGF